MNKIRLLYSMAFTGIGIHLATTCNGENMQKTNILMIAVDDLKPNLACYGDTIAITPAIDSIAASGMIFFNNQCQQAVCAPSRASLMSGLRPDSTKVWDLNTKLREVKPEVETIEEFFAKNGYITAAVGKIYHHEDQGRWTVPYVQTYDLEYNENMEKPVEGEYQSPEIRAIYNEALKNSKKKYPKGILKRKGVRFSTECLDLPDDAYSDGAIAKKAISLLRQLSSKDKPFMIVVGFKKPHLPFVAPKKYWDLYKRENIKVAEFQKHSLNAPDFAFQPGLELRNGYSDITVDLNQPLPLEKQKELIHGYYACVSYIDAQILKLVEELKKLKLDTNTIIVLWGDHGWHLGDHGMWCKHTNFEQAARAPLIISAPGVTRGSKTDCPSEFIDIFPTLCDLVGLNKPKYLEGKSLIALLKKPDVGITKFAVSQYPRVNKGKKVMGYSFRSDNIRYTAWLPWDEKNGAPESLIPVAEELYDYRNDPLETISRQNDAGYEAILSEHRQYMKAFFDQKEK